MFQLSSQLQHNFTWSPIVVYSSYDTLSMQGSVIALLAGHTFSYCTRSVLLSSHASLTGCWPHSQDSQGDQPQADGTHLLKIKIYPILSYPILSYPPTIPGCKLGMEDPETHHGVFSSPCAKGTSAHIPGSSVLPAW